MTGLWDKEFTFEGRQLRSFGAAAAVVVVLLTVNFLAWQFTKINFTKVGIKSFEDKVVELTHSAEEIVEKYGELIEDGKMLFRWKGSVKREDFVSFFEERGSGVEGLATVAYAERTDNVDGLAERVKNEGLPFFKVYPYIGGDKHYVVTYLSKQKENQQYLGYDLASNTAFVERVGEAKIAMIPSQLVLNASRMMVVGPVTDGWLVEMIDPDMLGKAIREEIESRFFIKMDIYDRKIDDKRLTEAKPMSENFLGPGDGMDEGTKIESVVYLPVVGGEWTLRFSSSYASQLDWWQRVVPTAAFVLNTVVIVAMGWLMYMFLNNWQAVRAGD